MKKISLYGGDCVGCMWPRFVKGGTSHLSWFVELHALNHYVGICR